MSSESNDDDQPAFRLELRIAHPLHEHHALAFIDSLDTLQRHSMLSFQEYTDASISRMIFRSSGFFQCDGCDVASFGLSYHCLECHFGLDAECAQLPVITIEGHPHCLLFLKRKPEHKNLMCGGCEEEITAPSFVRCVQCDAFLHVQCALPDIIKIKNHPHPILLSSPESTDDDSGPHSCNVCQEERDSISWVYSCATCRFVADIRCVIFDYEVPTVTEEPSLINRFLLALNESETDEDEVEEQEIHEIEMKPGLTLQQIIDSFSEAERAEYEAVAANAIKDVGGDDDSTGSENEIGHHYQNHFSYLERPLYDLLEKLELGDMVDPFEDLAMDSPTVLVDQYLATQELAGTLAGVLAKHGDITRTSNLSFKVKIMVCNLFSKVVDDMSKMEFSGVTEKLVVSWMFGIRMIQLTGFDAEFAMDRWKKVAMAFFGVQGKSTADELLAEMDQEIEEQSLKLQMLSGKREKHVNLSEKCEKEAQAMEGKTAGDGLI